MTRINIEPASSLPDRHAFAEWRELPRTFALAAAWQERVQGLPPGRPLPKSLRLPEHYTMGAGHVKFFYVRLGWLSRRHRELTRVLLKRGYSLSTWAPMEAPPGLDGDWSPTIEDRLVSLARLDERLRAKPHLYRLNGELVGVDYYSDIMARLRAREAV